MSKTGGLALDQGMEIEDREGITTVLSKAKKVGVRNRDRMAGQTADDSHDL
jgi:hypothetical protein